MSVRKARGYHSPKSPAEKGWVRQFTGDLRRYELDHGEALYVKLGPHLAECPELEFFIRDRILLRRLISRQFRLMACEVKNDKSANDSSTINLIRFKGYAPSYILALLNSSLFSYRVLSRSSIARRDDYPKISLYEVKTFPIRKVEFVTPESERLKRLKQLNDEYQMSLEKLGDVKETKCLSSGKLFGQTLSLVGAPGKPLQVPLDILHDFLAHLAEQMTDLHEKKNAELRRFLDWLENELKIHPDKDGTTGIQTLTGKTIITNYLGDYQKDEEHAPFEALWEVAQRNSRRLSCSLGTVFQERTRHEFEKSLSILLPIKRKLAATDWLIDQLVYRLYGLTEDEITIIEGR